MGRWFAADALAADQSDPLGMSVASTSNPVASTADQVQPMDKKSSVEY
jgi:hypothetical protein